MGQQGVEFRGKSEQPEGRSVMVIKRLFPETVAAGEKAPPLAVVDDESPHAVEMVDHVVAPLGISGEQHLGVGMISAKGLPAAHQFLPQSGKVVDLAVENDADGPFGIPHGLGTAFEVEDAQAAVTEEHAVVRGVAFVVRTAVRQAPRHAHEILPCARSDKSRNAAHGLEAGQPSARSKLRVERTR
jgi:hypothetical protein